MYFCCTYILVLLEFKDKFFFLGESVYRYDIVICWYFFFSLEFFAKVERCRLENTVVSLGKLCYGRAYLDFSPRRLVSCGSPLTEGVPLVASQLVMT